MTFQVGKKRFFDGDFLIMASPVSIGDAILLTQIAHKIGQAFTTGRKSAPAEFEEIQKLLWTLSEALKLVAREFSDTEQADTLESSEGRERSKEEETPGGESTSNHTDKQLPRCPRSSRSSGQEILRSRPQSGWDPRFRTETLEG